MSNSLGWYYREIGHRMKKNTKAGSSAIVRCSWCGCTSNLTPEQRKRAVHKVVRVCIDRQAMLFARVPLKSGLGWPERVQWAERFRS